jgi:hypothetical protein
MAEQHQPWWREPAAMGTVMAALVTAIATVIVALLSDQSPRDPGPTPTPTVVEPTKATTATQDAIVPGDGADPTDAATKPLDDSNNDVSDLEYLGDGTNRFKDWVFGESWINWDSHVTRQSVGNNNTYAPIDLNETRHRFYAEAEFSNLSGDGSQSAPRVGIVLTDDDGNTTYYAGIEVSSDFGSSKYVIVTDDGSDFVLEGSESAGIFIGGGLKVGLRYSGEEVGLSINDTELLVTPVREGFRPDRIGVYSSEAGVELYSFYFTTEMDWSSASLLNERLNIHREPANVAALGAHRLNERGRRVVLLGGEKPQIALE